MSLADANYFEDPRVKALIDNEPMLDGFRKLLYEHIRDAVRTAHADRPSYNPYLYESLLTDVAHLLDRCLMYRRECADLEAQAVRRALEDCLFDDLRPQQERLIQLLTSRVAIELQRSACDAASKDFKSSDAGFKTLYARTAEALQSQEDLKAGQEDAQLTILEFLKKHQCVLRKRHNTPGHALNYRERRLQVIALILKDTVEAYQKARAAGAGLAQQLGIVSDDPPFPTMSGTTDDATFLDRFVLWTRAIAQEYERRTQEEALFERVIPIVAVWAARNNETGARQLMGDAQFRAAMNSSGCITIDPTEALPSKTQVKDLRVRAFGVSIGTQNEAKEDRGIWSTYSWSCVVIPPAQADPLNENEPLQRGPVILGRVGVYQLDLAPDMYAGPGVWNVDPRGEWTIVVDRLMNNVAPDFPTPGAGWPRSVNWLNDIKLHFRLAGGASKRAGDWIVTDD